MADAEEQGVEAEDITMVASKTPTTAEMTAPSTTGTVTGAGTDTEPDNRTGVDAPTVERFSVQLHQAICIDPGCAGDWCGMGGRCGLSASTMERNSMKQNQPLGLQH